jgi:hypothetical protein
MIADVQISRIHKSSPYNVAEFVQNVRGATAYDIMNSPKIQKIIDKTFGKELRVSVLPRKGLQVDYEILKVKAII